MTEKGENPQKRALSGVFFTPLTTEEDTKTHRYLLIYVHLQ